MADVASIRVADLLIDEHNPRLSQPNKGQRDALRTIAARQDKKLLKLAEDIAKNGVNPADLFIVVPTKEQPPRYTVLEGNRRLCALKGLESPEALSGAIPPTVLSALKRLSADYLESPVDAIRCVIFTTREQAQHWLVLRHTGENEGAGVVPWGADETARFRGMVRGTTEPFRQALDFAEKSGYLTRTDRDKLHATTFKRLIDTPAVREKLGITVKSKELLVIGDPQRVAKALAWVAHDLVNRDLSVGEVYDIKKRLKYARQIPSAVVVKATGAGVPATSASTAIGRPKPEPKSRRRPTRDHLIPADCVLTIHDARTREIEQELRKLSLQEYPNGVAALFRVFIELSVDWYVGDQGIALPQQPKLAEKLKAVGEHLLKRAKLTLQSVKPVRQAAQKGQYLGASITLMNDYVHNSAMFPAPGDLRSHWNSLQPFISAIWSP